MKVEIGQQIVVIKQNISGIETWRYSGKIVGADEHSITINALFNRDDTPFHGIMLCRNDLFVETYFDNRWYNIFEIHDRQTNTLKGWYCNITRPAVFAESQISYIDLALDLLVYPDFKQLILDEDEFAQLSLSSKEQTIARQALLDLQLFFKNLSLKNPRPGSGQ